MQHLQHAVPAVALLVTGIQGLSEPATGGALSLAVVEVVSSGLLLISLARHLRHSFVPPAGGHHHAHPGRVDWVAIWTGSMLLAEAWERWHVAHHVARPIILLAAVTLTMGLAHARVTRWSLGRRALRVSDDGLRIGGPPWRRFRAAWGDITEITITETDAIIHTPHRSRRIRLSDLDNRDEVRAALEQARRRVVTSGAPPTDG